MKFQFLTRVNRNKNFQFTPRFYDERKERLDAMIAKNENSSDTEYDYKRKEALKDSITSAWGRGNHRIKQKKTSNIRVIIILLSILTLGYLVFSNSKKEEIIIHKID